MLRHTQEPYWQWLHDRPKVSFASHHRKTLQTSQQHHVFLAFQQLLEPNLWLLCLQAISRSV